MTPADTHEELLIVFAKASAPGNVKTRLVPPLTDGEAAELNSAFILDTVARHRLESRHLRICLSIRGDRSNGFGPRLAAEIDDAEIRDQKGDGLGRRMEHALEEAFGDGYGSVVILGSDHPSLPRQLVTDAFRRLEAAPTNPPVVVLGPAADGGYYLIGMNRLVREAFRDMAYSHDRVLRDTVQRLRRAGAHIELLSEWYDVDDEVGLRMLTKDMESGRAGSLPHTERALRRIGCEVRMEADAGEGGA